MKIFDRFFGVWLVVILIGVHCASGIAAVDNVEDFNFPANGTITTKNGSSVQLRIVENSSAPIRLNVIDMQYINKHAKESFVNCEITGYGYVDKISSGYRLMVVASTLGCSTESNSKKYFKLDGQVKGADHEIGLSGKITEDLEGIKSISINSGIVAYVVH